MFVEKVIFVFGSNLSGIHGAGAAKHAFRFHGAQWGKGSGLIGDSYAIPTKDQCIRTLPLEEIKKYVDEFIEFAWLCHHLTFQVTRIGCGLAGYKDEQIAPMFVGAPSNCFFDETWKPILGEGRNYFTAYV